jgi:hypothetical protein
MEPNNEQHDEAESAPAEASAKTDPIDAAFAEWEARYEKVPKKEKDKRQRWLEIRKRAGRKIDPEIAEVMWIFGYDFDPYGISPELPEELQQIGRQYFARSPGSDIWVCFNDLPIATAKALYEKYEARLAFPAGLPPMEDNDASVVSEDVNGGLVVKISESVKRQAAKGAAQMAKLAEEILYDAKP